jgi:hypothetical protein
MENNSCGLNEAEQNMFLEISAVMQKYKEKTRSFGISLLHSHFPLLANEILHETNNKEKRVMTIRPVLNKKVSKKAHPTAWSIIPETGQVKVIQLCCD